VCFPLTHLPGRGTADMVKHTCNTATSVPISSSRHIMPVSLTSTMQICTEPPVVERCSSQALENVTLAQCAPLELLLNGCSMWPQHRAAVFSISLWLCIDSDVELSDEAQRSNSLSSLSTTELPTGACFHSLEFLLGVVACLQLVIAAVPCCFHIVYSNTMSIRMAPCV